VWTNIRLKPLLLAGVATATLANQSDLPSIGFCTVTRLGDPPMVDRLAPEQLGTVSFANSCRPAVQADFNRGVALLHSFWLDEAERLFKKVAAADPDCAMADWGIAMAEFNEVNGGPTTGGVVWAKIALKQADDALEKDRREATYIHALHRFFDDYTVKDSDLYAGQYTDAMAIVAAKYPKDIEAQIFYALALINSDPPDDVALANPKKAVAILYPLFRRHPDHPGIAHYIIHACDNPEMATLGLEAARRYASIAPAAPHALHMPAHIFARLGLWEDDLRSNLASKAAAERSTAHVGAENRLHAMEFLEYAYLQIGHYDNARAIVGEAQTVKESDVDSRYPDYYTTVESRYPALFAIETRDWNVAAKLKPIAGADWYAQGQTLLANAMAAGHLHDAQGGRAAEATIESLIAAKPYLRTGSPRASLPDEIRAWARFSRGELDGALALLRPVADRQARVGKGEVELPAREMIAEMLSLRGKFHEALAEYQASLITDPNRFTALLGAAHAAERLGKRQTAVKYYRALIGNCSCPNGQAIRDLEHARLYLSRIAKS
jgi:tetratricopeptide (TPR) repeat protein